MALAFDWVSWHNKGIIGVWVGGVLTGIPDHQLIEHLNIVWVQEI